jgi:two-component system phosphate regulon sensor histidine kinase PhoR
VHLDLRRLARIEAGDEAFQPQRLPLAGVVQACVQRHGARALAGDLQLIAEPPKDGADDIAAWADEEAVSQILDNLVDNALKYTPAKGVIAVRWRREDDTVCLEVEDTGAGIPQHDLPRIFERFYRADKARSRELGGTGLGLAIVKHLVQAMRGGIEATSQLGKGTRFIVRLPRAGLDLH